jgi:addiction module RelE/StbE family toxin
MRVYAASNFTRAVGKLPLNIRNKLREKDQIFRRDPFDPRLKTHKLRGNLKNYWSYSVDRRYRLLFKFLDGDEVVYYDVGTHKVYR